MQLLMFNLFAVGAVVSALLMVTSKRPVRAAMSLIATMSFLAGIYALLDAHLIAALQLIVYAGAIMVLFLFVIMLLNIEEKEGRLTGSALLLQLLGIFLVALVFVAVVKLFKLDPAAVSTLAEGAYPFGTTKAVGKLLFTEYVLPFEIASLLLLAAVVGAVILAKRKIDGSEQ